MTKITIHLHSVHYLDSGLPLQEYMILLMYEQKADWTVKELAKYLCITDRTVTRFRLLLVEQGYLMEREVDNVVYPKKYFELTDKLYPAKKKVVNQSV